jgi:hypothetical protein
MDNKIWHTSSRNGTAKITSSTIASMTSRPIVTSLHEAGVETSAVTTGPDAEGQG